MRYHYRNVKAMTKVYKPCLSFIISFSFSRLSHSVHRLSLFIDPSTLTVCWYTRHMKRCQSYFIVLTVRTRNVRNHDRLEWLLNHILSFSHDVRDHDRLQPVWGSPQQTHTRGEQLWYFEAITILEDHISRLWEQSWLYDSNYIWWLINPTVCFMVNILWVIMYNNMQRDDIRSQYIIWLTNTE